MESPSLQPDLITKQAAVPLNGNTGGRQELKLLGPDPLDSTNGTVKIRPLSSSVEERACPHPLLLL